MPNTRSRRAQASTSATVAAADPDGDPAFIALPHNVQARIDRAFDRTLRATSKNALYSSAPPPKRRKATQKENGAAEGVSIPDDASVVGGFLHDDTTESGGFIIEDTNQTSGFVVDWADAGGFIPDDTDTSRGTVDLTVPSLRSGTSTRDPSASAESSRLLPLAHVPTALQFLDLPPDDPEVLKIFANAAAGWSARGSTTEEDAAVSLKDWRAVCAVLLEGAEDKVGTDGPQGGESEDAQEESDDEGASDEYMDEDEDDEDDGVVEDGDYGEGPASVRRRHGGQTGRRAASSDSDEQLLAPKPLTARQKTECRHAFALFLDASVEDEHLDKKRIMIKDVDRAATLLKEKLTADEIVEMLEVFSTASDKSMSLGDFERMMVEARLV